ncbi:type VII secretion-associated protein [Nocardia sp. NEAU-G5]|uniref:Type VII secretion-associated protein n=1 Tax=Nocardia albiluteola TaxID=2842303 RepID=A0ABS6B9V5_9NOCA|nr:type VII secretion-associated protein [Nocardia albiluteola]MBU3067086.1 type VII secretion-associated protein [Nocardia albiluteola]
MSVVDVVLSDNRLWARSESTHWDGPPSIVPASDGTSFVVGEQLRPQYPAVSMVRLAAADRIAFSRSQLPPITDAWAVTLGAVLNNLSLPTPCEQLTIVGPSDWGRRRRAAVEAAARRMVQRVSIEPLARRAASLGASTAQQQRIAVLELNPLSTTVTLVGRSGQDTWIQACEHEPTVGLADVDEGHGLPDVVAVIARLLAGQPPTYLLAAGVSDPALLEALSAILAQQCGFPVDVRPLSGVELIRGAHPGMSMPPAPAALAPPVEFDSLHQQAVATRPPETRRNALYIGIAAAAVLVLVAIGAVIALTAGSKSKPTAAPTSAAVPSPGAVTTTSAPPQPPQSFGHLQIRIPSGWHVSKQVGDNVYLSPDDGSRQRITIEQKALTAGATVDNVADSLDVQIKRSPAGRFSELTRNAVFADRSGLSYEEYPGGGTTVRWQVLVDSDVEASIGCQYPQDKWQALAPTCEQVVRDVKFTQ